jgi:hypothetical protein
LFSHWAAGLDPTIIATALGLETLDPWQIDVLRARDHRLCLNVHRQGGKSTTAAVLAVHTALYSPGSLIIMVSPSQRQSAELFRRALTLYRALGRPVSPEAENALSLTLESGSRIVSLPGDERTVRGYSNVALLIVDEAARVEDELVAAVSPMLAISRGRFIAMSTPWGKRGWWYEATRSRDWRTVTVPATECPRLSADVLEAERRSLGELRFRSEYMAEFVNAYGSMFDGDDLDAAFSIGQLGAVPPGALFGGSTSPADLRIVDAVRPSVGPCPLSDDGRHFWNDGFCIRCRVRQEPSQAPTCTHPQLRNGVCRLCGAIVRPALGATA